MKKYSYIFTTVILVFCFLISSSFLWFDDCISMITIFNSLPSDITVTIDGESKRLPPWGSCKESVGENEYKIFPCGQTWKIKWESPEPRTFIDYCMSDNDEDEEDIEDWEEEELICEDYEVDVEFEGVKGLDRSVILSDGQHYLYDLSINGFKRQ
jgi:hypothetical protein